MGQLRWLRGAVKVVGGARRVQVSWVVVLCQHINYTHRHSGTQAHSMQARRHTAHRHADTQTRWQTHTCITPGHLACRSPPHLFMARRPPPTDAPAISMFLTACVCWWSSTCRTTLLYSMVLPPFLIMPSIQLGTCAGGRRVVCFHSAGDLGGRWGGGRVIREPAACLPTRSPACLHPARLGSQQGKHKLGTVVACCALDLYYTPS